ncbi:DUF4407 domain-containing protein [Desulfococcaceae bacterium HSG8]|nr:DUF4407 domain-containing protein [Desulfococcaceae bacterium HSG8]
MSQSKFYKEHTKKIGFFTKFLWWCSGTVSDILEECPTEKSTYQGIGAAVFFTSVLAALTGGYALFFVFDKVELSVIFGIFWGLLIFNLDRYIITSINRSGDLWKQTWTTLPRILLAVSIAFIISKPLQLKIFEKEINQQLEEEYVEALATHAENLEKRERALTGYYLGAVQSKIKTTEDEMNKKSALVERLNSELIQEIQGFTGIRGDGPAAKQIRNFLEDNRADLKSLRTQLKELKEQEKSLRNKKEKEMKTKHMTAKVLRSEGLLSRLNALESLKQKSRTTWWTDFFIFFLFLFVEVAPVFIKIFSPKGIYDELEARAAIVEKEDVLESLNNYKGV